MKEQIMLPGETNDLPYSSAIRYENLLFVSGQVGENDDGIPGDIKMQTELAIENAKKVIEAAGASINNVLMCRCFLRKADDFSGMNEIYEKYFGGNRNVAPARYTVLAPPVDERYLIEIAMIVGM